MRYWRRLDNAAKIFVEVYGFEEEADGTDIFIYSETLIIFTVLPDEQIQEVSDMGDSIKAELLKRFVDEELIQGKVSSALPFDVAFDNWCKEEMKEKVIALALKWGLDKELLNKAVQSYDVTMPEKIPYMEELGKSLCYENALEKAPNILVHNMELRVKLPKEIKEIKEKYL